MLPVRLITSGNDFHTDWLLTSGNDYHTGWPRVTTPYSSTTLGWRNWPMMAASCRNRTVSLAEDPSFRVLIAHSTSAPSSSWQKKKKRKRNLQQTIAKQLLNKHKFNFLEHWTWYLPEIFSTFFCKCPHREEQPFMHLTNWSKQNTEFSVTCAFVHSPRPYT